MKRKIALALASIMTLASATFVVSPTRTEANVLLMHTQGNDLIERTDDVGGWMLPGANQLVTLHLPNAGGFTGEQRIMALRDQSANVPAPGVGSMVTGRHMNLAPNNHGGLRWETSNGTVRTVATNAPVQPGVFLNIVPNDVQREAVNVTDMFRTFDVELTGMEWAFLSYIAGNVGQNWPTHAFSTPDRLFHAGPQASEVFQSGHPVAQPNPTAGPGIPGLTAHRSLFFAGDLHSIGTPFEGGSTLTPVASLAEWNAAAAADRFVNAIAMVPIGQNQFAANGTHVHTRPVFRVADIVSGVFGDVNDILDGGNNVDRWLTWNAVLGWTAHFFEQPDSWVVLNQAGLDAIVDYDSDSLGDLSIFADRLVAEVSHAPGAPGMWFDAAMTFNPGANQPGDNDVWYVYAAGAWTQQAAGTWTQGAAGSMRGAATTITRVESGTANNSTRMSLVPATPTAADLPNLFIQSNLLPHAGEHEILDLDNMTMQGLRDAVNAGEGFAYFTGNENVRLAFEIVLDYNRPGVARVTYFVARQLYAEWDEDAGDDGEWVATGDLVVLPAGSGYIHTPVVGRTSANAVVATLRSVPGQTAGIINGAAVNLTRVARAVGVRATITPVTPQTLERPIALNPLVITENDWSGLGGTAGSPHLIAFQLVAPSGFEWVAATTIRPDGTRVRGNEGATQFRPNTSIGRQGYGSGVQLAEINSNLDIDTDGTNTRIIFARNPEATRNPGITATGNVGSNARLTHQVTQQTHPYHRPAYFTGVDNLVDQGWGWPTGTEETLPVARNVLSIAIALEPDARTTATSEQLGWITLEGLTLAPIFGYTGPGDDRHITIRNASGAAGGNGIGGGGNNAIRYLALATPAIVAEGNFILQRGDFNSHSATGGFDAGPATVVAGQRTTDHMGATGNAANQDYRNRALPGNNIVMRFGETTHNFWNPWEETRFELVDQDGNLLDGAKFSSVGLNLRSYYGAANRTATMDIHGFEGLRFNVGTRGRAAWGAEERVFFNHSEIAPIGGATLNPGTPRINNPMATLEPGTTTPRPHHRSGWFNTDGNTFSLAGMQANYAASNNNNGNGLAQILLVINLSVDVNFHELNPGVTAIYMRAVGPALRGATVAPAFVANVLQPATIDAAQNHLQIGHQTYSVGDIIIAETEARSLTWGTAAVNIPGTTSRRQLVISLTEFGFAVDTALSGIRFNPIGNVAATINNNIRIDSNQRTSTLVNHASGGMRLAVVGGGAQGGSLILEVAAPSNANEVSVITLHNLAVTLTRATYEGTFGLILHGSAIINNSVWFGSGAGGNLIREDLWYGSQDRFESRGIVVDTYFTTGRYTDGIGGRGISSRLSFSFATGTTAINVDGLAITMSDPVINHNGMTYLPLRAMAEIWGLDTSHLGWFWQPMPDGSQAQVVWIEIAGRQIQFVIGTNIIQVDGAGARQMTDVNGNPIAEGTILLTPERAAAMGLTGPEWNDSMNRTFVPLRPLLNAVGVGNANIAAFDGMVFVNYAFH